MVDIRRSPPLFEEDDTNSIDEDLFKTPLDIKSPPSQLESNTNGSNHFADATDEVPLFDPESKNAQLDVESEPLGVMSAPKSFNTAPASDAITPEVPVSLNAIATAPSTKAPPGFRSVSKPKDEESPINDGSKYEIAVTITSPKKIGDGVGAYMVYKVITKTNIPDFRKFDMEVFRRFSDFLGLHEKLVQKHLHQGCIIPPPPEKSVIVLVRTTPSRDLNDKARTTPSRDLNDKARTTPSRDLNDEDRTTPSRDLNDKARTTPSRDLNGKARTTSSRDLNDKARTTPSRDLNDNARTTPSRDLNDEDRTTPSRDLNDKARTTPSRDLNGKARTTSSRDLNDKARTTPSRDLNDKAVLDKLALM